MVLAFAGHAMSEEDIAAALGTTEGGTLFDDIAKVAALGFEATITMGTLGDLREVHTTGKPLIASVDTLYLPTHSRHAFHTVAVVGATDTAVWVHDPWWNSGPDIISVAQFETAWRMRRYLTASVVRATIAPQRGGRTRSIRMRE
jgi:predicted double-glycine peptidase